MQHHPYTEKPNRQLPFQPLAQGLLRQDTPSIVEADFRQSKSVENVASRPLGRQNLFESKDWLLSYQLAQRL